MLQVASDSSDDSTNTRPSDVYRKTVASLRLVSPGAVTDGVTLFFVQIVIVITPTLSARFSSILCKFSRKIDFHLGANPWMVSPGAPPPLVTPLSEGLYVFPRLLTYCRKYPSRINVPGNVPCGIVEYVGCWCILDLVIKAQKDCATSGRLSSCSASQLPLL